MIKVLFIPHDINEPISIREIKDSADEHLQQMQDMVGGYIESIPTSSPEIEIYVNEEGKLLGLPINYRASELYHNMWNNNSRLVVSSLLGNVFITGPINLQGNITSISSHIADIINKT